MIVPGENLRWLFPKPEDDDLSNHAHRQLVGYVGLVLPILLWLVAGLRPTAGLEPPWQPLDSISAYYHSAAVSVLSGSLVALSLFLLSYRGYDNDYGRRDRVLAIIAGGAALVVALFPTGAPDPVPPPSWWQPLTGTIHHVSAVVLFCSFVFFALFQFPQSKGKVSPLQFPGVKSEQRDVGKWVRNWIYIACGVGMVICLAWAGGAALADKPLFWPEALALEFFAVSWLVKGRTDATVNKAWNKVRGRQTEESAAPESTDAGQK
jgi:hypothetical protein